MKPSIYLSLFVTALALAGCAAAPAKPPRPALTAEEWERTQPVRCASDAQCAQMWSRAQGWLVEHSPYKIQTVTDSVIQTYGSGRFFQLAYTVTKVAQQDGHLITLLTDCGTTLSCEVDIERTKIDFYDHIRVAIP